MWLIAESLTAGLLVSLFNKYILNKNLFESCMCERVEEDINDMSSVTTSISDSSTIHHIHV